MPPRLVDGLNHVYGALHCGIEPGGPCKEKAGLNNHLQCPGAPCQGNFHEYTIEVDRSAKPEKIAWTVDGQYYQTVKEHDVGTETWSQAVHHGHFLLLNVAIGGMFPDGIRKSRTPIPETVPGKPMLVDWVAVYYSL